MNRNEYLKNLEIKNRRLLLKIYEREIKKLKIKIYEATEKGNDTVYLQKLHDEVEQEIKVFKQALKGYSVKSATDSYKGGAVGMFPSLEIAKIAFRQELTIPICLSFELFLGKNILFMDGIAIT